MTVDPGHRDPPWLVALKKAHAVKPGHSASSATRMPAGEADPDCAITLEEWRRRNVAPVMFVEPREPG